MAEMGTEPDSDSKSKIWRLTGSGFKGLGLGLGPHLFVKVP